jgi:hypothetical protein
MDYRKLLGKRTTEVLPHLGGTSVAAPKRRLRVTAEVEPGWWRFAITGRRAEPEERAEPPDMSALRSLRGHLVGSWLFASGDRPERVHLLPDDELEVLTVVRARRWSEGLWVFDTIDFEGDAELEAREALDDRRPIADIKGVAASLRAAYGWALLSRVAADRDIPVALSESLGHLRDVAERGTGAADELLTALDTRRREAREQQRWAEERVAIRRAVERARTIERTFPERIEAALDKAGAVLRRFRTFNDGSAEVRFWFMGETFISVVEIATLRVIDSGICLSGADRVTNLQSLASVIREAIATDQLCITRR